MKPTAPTDVSLLASLVAIRGSPFKLPQQLPVVLRPNQFVDRCAMDIGVEAVINVDEAAEILGISPRTLRVWVSRQEIPSFLVGSLRKFRTSELEEWLQERHIPAAN